MKCPSNWSELSIDEKLAWLDARNELSVGEKLAWLEARKEVEKA